MNQSAELESLKRDSVIREACKGLAETQVEKLIKLADNRTIQAKTERLAENIEKDLEFFRTQTLKVD